VLRFYREATERAPDGLSLFAALDALPLALTRRPVAYCWIRALREEALPGPDGGRR